MSPWGSHSVIKGLPRLRLSDSADSVPSPSSRAADKTPVTAWLRQLEAGDVQAAESLYEHFCNRLQELVRRRIPANIRSTYDQEDASVSAFHSLFLGVRKQRYQLNDRGDFWRLLLTIAERKILKRIRHETRDKRDVGRLVQNSVFMPMPAEDSAAAHPTVEGLTGREPTPDFAAEVAEACETLLALLPDDTARQIARLKFENHTADEIATKLGCTRRTVQRKLLVIRRTWQHVVEIDTEADEVSQNRQGGALED
jgi:RNA polymerase sigma factor (sigma-70 family)